MSKKVKIFAIVVLIISALIAAVTFLGHSSTPAVNGPLSSSVPTTSNGTTQAPGSSASSEFATLLSSISNITIDTSLFTDPGYLALRDYPIALGSDIQGRPNPFAAVGYDTGSISSTAPTTPTQTQFDTIQPDKITATTAEVGAQAILSDTSQALVVFEYGINGSLDNATAPQPLPSNGTVLFRISGLTPGTKYSVKAILAQGSDTTPGNVVTFTTLPK